MQSSTGKSGKKELSMTYHTDNSSPERETILAKSVDEEEALQDLYCQMKIINKKSEWEKELICEKLGHTTSDTQIQLVKSELLIKRHFSLEIDQEFKQTKQNQQKIWLYQNDHKSESEANYGTSIQNSQQSFDLYKHSWLTNKKTISVQSVNFQDKQAIEGPESWSNCTVQLCNSEKTKTYTLECSKDHNLASIIKLLAKLEKRSKEVFSLIFLDENSQKMAEQSFSLLEIAKSNQTQIIHVSFERVQF